MIEACLGCGAPWREGARFCGRCGATEDGKPPAREELAAVGPRGLGAALTVYFLTLGVLVMLWLMEAGTQGIFAAYGALALVGLGGAAWLGRESWGLFRLPSLGWRGALLALVSLGGVAALVYGLVSLFPSLYIDENAAFRAEGRSLGYAILAMAACPALVEELLFRGVILTGLRGVFHPRTAVLVSGLMFATIHISVVSLSSHTLLGVIFGAVCLGSRSLWPGVVLHFGWNAGVLLIGW